ncbi:hypothetical protein POX_e06699 [Penicillium oxalicum]|uniref:hypothetical protein n=1 Tax=Penicillium oxalicum TaxID=69781 RepID=UPI0020B7F974|nr:hypothetical protein POX_e06699 [Penicillium oxalicum]KAI2788678.1 hypothetical protein POX_e06699 [Penicillium oxalicum]
MAPNRPEEARRSRSPWRRPGAPVMTLATSTAKPPPSPIFRPGDPHRARHCGDLGFTSCEKERVWRTLRQSPLGVYIQSTSETIPTANHHDHHPSRWAFSPAQLLNSETCGVFGVRNAGFLSKPSESTGSPLALLSSSVTPRRVLQSIGCSSLQASALQMYSGLCSTTVNPSILHSTVGCLTRSNETLGRTGEVSP